MDPRPNDAGGAPGDGGASAARPLVLLIEDDTTLVSSLSYYLDKNGFSVTSAGDGLGGLNVARSLRPDIIVLDLLLPKMDGLEVCRRVRHESDVPILILSAKADETDRVAGLEVGADDYMSKPFGMRELTARLRSLLRRAGPKSAAASSVTRFGSIELDARGRSLRKEGREIPLKAREFDLLVFLVANSGQVFTRQQLVEKIWGYEFFGGSRTVDVHVRWVREKIEDDPSRPRHLLTVRGTGYKLVK